jgi:hypothetical protein
MIEVGKAHRTIQARHSFTSTPLRYRVEQRLEHLVVIDTLEPAETTLLDVPCLVGTMIYDNHDATHHLAVAMRRVDDKFAHFECRIFTRREGIYLVENDWRSKAIIALVEVDAKLHKATKFTFCLYLFYNDLIWVSSIHY